MSEDRNSRIVLLNRLISRSVSRAPQGNYPPTHGADELLRIIDQGRKTNSAIEYEGLEAKETEIERHEAGMMFPFIRLSDFRIIDRAESRYACLLIEHGDNAARALHLINTRTFQGREISGEEYEFGATSTHLVVRLPTPDESDEGMYRAAVEAVSPITRGQIEWFLCAQLRRHANKNQFEFEADISSGRKGKRKPYKYHPRLELVSDVGRKINLGIGGQSVSSIVFTKRGVLREVAGETTIEYDTVVANAEFRINAKEGPTDPDEQIGWFRGMMKHWHDRGFKSRLYFKGLGGKEIGGVVHRDLAGAADLLLCHKERIVFADYPPKWRPSLCDETVRQLIELVDKDELWRQSGQD